MKDIADDLLDELVELEDSSRALEKQVKRVETNKKTLDKMANDSNASSMAVILEATALAQESAVHNQQAAEMNLKIHTEQKLQLEELSEVGTSWRHAIRAANQEVKTSKNFFIGIFVVTLFVAVAAIAGLSWLLISQQKNERQFQSNMLDLIQTESAMHYRQVNLKIDELASVLELVASENRLPLALSEKTTATLPTATTLATQETIIAVPTAETEQLALVESTNINHSLSEQTLNQMKALLDEHKTVIVELHNKQPSTSTKVDLTETNIKLNKIEQVLLAQSKQLHDAIKALSTGTAVTKATQTSTQTVIDLDKHLAKQDLRIMAQIEELKKVLDQLTAIQQQTQSEIKALTDSVEKSQAPKPDQPYSYRNPYQYKD